MESKAYIDVYKLGIRLQSYPIREEFRFRVAALIKAHMIDGASFDEAHRYWLAKRPDFFTAEAQSESE